MRTRRAFRSVRAAAFATCLMAAPLALTVLANPGAALAEEHDEAEIGPAVGAQAPDFRLQSVTDGTELTLSESREEGPVVLVFFRGSW